MKIVTKKTKKVKTLNTKLKKYRWAFKMFVLALCLSSVFSLLSQSIMSSLGLFTSIVTISIFIFISIVFDMIGIAVTSCSEDFFNEKINEKVSGAEIALNLCNNSEKVCSFCADVVGDICGILSGSGVACVILSISNKIHNNSLFIIISTLLSALIAGLTILGKACMKEKAIKNSNKIILNVGKILEKLFFIKKKKKNSWQIKFIMILYAHEWKKRDPLAHQSDKLI